VPISLSTCAACVASRVAWISATGMAGSNTVTFVPKSCGPGRGDAAAADAVTAVSSTASASAEERRYLRVGMRWVLSAGGAALRVHREGWL